MVLLDGHPRSAAVVATNELQVLKLPGRQFLCLLERNAGVALTILTDIGARLRRVERRRVPGLS
jgi:CRP-like cAMP-binding protein